MTDSLSADVPSPARRTHRYTLGDVLEFTGVVPNVLRRWLDAGIIKTAGGGSQGRRRDFTFRNLVEIVVCDVLRSLRVNEAGLREVVAFLNGHWNQANASTDRDAAFLWIALIRYSLGQSEIIEPSLLLCLVDEATLVSRLTTGEADGSGIADDGGIAVPLRRIIKDLERATKDVFDAGNLKPQLTERLTELLGPSVNEEEK